MKSALQIKYIIIIIIMYTGAVRDFPALLSTRMKTECPPVTQTALALCLFGVDVLHFGSVVDEWHVFQAFFL